MPESVVKQLKKKNRPKARKTLSRCDHFALAIVQGWAAKRDFILTRAIAVSAYDLADALEAEAQKRDLKEPSP